jgi:cardiolipin synthase
VSIFRPERWWRLERKLLRRLHRKLAVVDDRIAFVGGINIVSDYTEVPVAEGGQRAARYDFAVRCEGPVVAAVSLRRAVRRGHHERTQRDLQRSIDRARGVIR